MLEIHTWAILGKRNRTSIMLKSFPWERQKVHSVKSNKMNGLGENEDVEVTTLWNSIHSDGLNILEKNSWSVRCLILLRGGRLICTNIANSSEKLNRNRWVMHYYLVMGIW